MAVKSQSSRFNFQNYILWARENLFNDRLNSVLTVLIVTIVVVLAFFVIRYVLFQANWIGVTDNLRFFYAGSYPEDEYWRLWISLAVGMAVISTIYGIWGSAKKYTIIIGALAVILLFLGFDFIPSWLNAVSFGLAIPFQNSDGSGVSQAWLSFGGILIGSYAISFLPYIPIKGRSLRTIRGKPIVLGSALGSIVVAIVVAILLQQGIFASSWGGLFIDIMVFSVGGGIIMLPLGLMLALARSSRFPVLSYFATAYIEIIRAGPLVVWLIFAQFLWTFFIPAEPILSIRAMLIFGFFGAAYIAEVVRGGLQSISRGQYEAAFSLNFTTYTTYTRIILPQAIRAVVPAIIGRYISIWKDTSLLAALGITNLLGAGRGITTLDFRNFAFLIEIYLVIAIIYWLVSFALSRFGRYTEKNLNL